MRKCEKTFDNHHKIKCNKHDINSKEKQHENFPHCLSFVCSFKIQIFTTKTLHEGYFYKINGKSDMR